MLYVKTIRPRSSEVEHSLGKGEVDSSILSAGTSFGCRIKKVVPLFQALLELFGAPVLMYWVDLKGGSRVLIVIDRIILVQN